MLHTQVLCQQKGGDGGGEGGGVTQGYILIGLAVKAPWLGPGGANSHPGCMDRLRKHYSHLLGDSLLAEKAAWAQSRGMTTESADYRMLVDEWAWSR